MSKPPKRITDTEAYRMGGGVLIAAIAVIMVALGFEHGHLMADPDGLTIPGGQQVRVVPFLPGDDVRPQPLIPLIQEAARIACLTKEQKQALFLQKQLGLRNED